MSYSGFEQSGTFTPLYASGYWELTVPLDVHDLNYDTKLSPEHRKQKLKAIRDAQKTISAALDLLSGSGIPVRVRIGEKGE